MGFGGCVSEEGNPDGNGASISVAIPTSGATSPSSYPGMNLVWEDEFEGNLLNTSNWSHETGTGQNGWGNNELQFYKQENTSLQDGYLVITAKKRIIRWKGVHFFTDHNKGQKNNSDTEE
ncbi:hypothetical protein [Algoriphagus boritolerans]|uniref:glycoside hydrolase family 16 protein n=1 Tax=Algoriphagus boritolerans TaxID=308111 RepID=UPI000A7890B9